MRDIVGGELDQHLDVIGHLERTFKIFGGHRLDTPVAELKSVIQDRYGENSKLVYELKDQGGEISCLRYDLTLPFMRFVTSNNIKNMRRYQIGKVYRRDQPSMAHGRYREFQQADFDILGHFPTMTAEAEILALIVECMHSVEMKKFRIIVNDRRILRLFLESADISIDLFHSVCSSIDKFDKLEKDDVRDELIAKGLSEVQANSLLKRISHFGPLSEVIDSIPDDLLREEYRHLETFLRGLKILDYVFLDFRLARGLDYYTGMIFEIKSDDVASSVAGGGRYNANLKTELPAIGFSIGIDRLCKALKHHVIADKNIIGIVSVGLTQAYEAALNLATEIRTAGIPVIYHFDYEINIGKQIRKFARQDINVIIIIGEAELVNSVVQIKNLHLQTQITVARDDLITYLTNTYVK